MALSAQDLSRIRWHRRVRELSAATRDAYLALAVVAPPSGEVDIALATDVFAVLSAAPADIFPRLGRAGLLLPTRDGVLVIHPDIADGAEVFA